MRDTRYGAIKGTTAIGAFDFSYKSESLIVRGNADYGYVGDAMTISTVKRNLTSNSAPYKKTPVGENAMAAGLEAGYDILRLFNDGASDKVFLFGRYDWYDSYIPASGQQEYEYTARHIATVGINWMPLPQIAVKAEYSHRFLKSQFNNEPSVSIGIAYQGFFNR